MLRSLFIIWALILTPLQAGLWRCAKATVQAVERVSLFGAEVPVPLGINAAAFQQLVTRSFQAELPLRALIALGSRTHFTYGYPPEPDSDLDVVLLFDAAHESDARRGFDRSALEGLGAPVQWVPGEVGFEGFLRGWVCHFPATQAEERRLFTDAAYRPWYWGGGRRSPRRTREVFRDLAWQRSPFVSAQERQWEREGRFNFFLPKPSTFVVNKEAVILIRAGEGMEQHAQALREREYQHVFVIQP